MVVEEKNISENKPLNKQRTNPKHYFKKRNIKIPERNKVPDKQTKNTKCINFVATSL